ncbi:unnamed protein product [Leptidea sinapis]|uniref:Uncharacterized protein n=1 Tax=Leptidea sinapis TaxID=189913 RepID=A0A5E4QYI6_9NEOP|nr:unnamed protein product [Leptidea sinapis]
MESIKRELMKIDWVDLFTPMNNVDDMIDSFYKILNSLIDNQNIVFQQLKTVNIHKGAGGDGIHPFLISSCAKELTEPVTYLFQVSMETASFRERTMAEHSGGKEGKK